MIKIKGGGDPLARHAAAVTKAIHARVTKPVTKPKGGRPKRYETPAERQAAYRERKQAHG